MDWLKEHSYLAPWLAPVVTVIIAVIQKKGDLARLDWYAFTMYMLLLVSFAVSLSSSFDVKARDYPLCQHD
ncbi:MAG: hypothetical protein ABSH05_26935 [Bryobacteraceae bacterium]|jgi:hypothetical protein